LAASHRQPVRTVQPGRRGWDPGCLARWAMKRAGLAALYLGWLYGVTFLLVVGLIRRTSSPHLATHAQAQAFGATTDTYLTAALLVNLVLPIAGALCAWLFDDRYWMQHFYV